MTITILTVIAGFVILGPRIIGYNPYIILSGSMYPDIPTGSVAIVHVTDKNADIGDVIAYQLNDGVPVIHRIVDKNEETGNYIMKGDANNTIDAIEVEQSQIIGRFVKCIPYAGYILQYFEYPQLHIGGLAFPGPILFLISAILILNVADSLLSENEEEENE